MNRRAVAIEILQRIDEENDHALAPGVCHRSFFNSRRGAGRQNTDEEQEKP
jgi:hypothetical protein